MHIGGGHEEFGPGFGEAGKIDSLLQNLGQRIGAAARDAVGRIQTRRNIGGDEGRRKIERPLCRSVFRAGRAGRGSARPHRPPASRKSRGQLSRPAGHLRSGHVPSPRHSWRRPRFRKFRRTAARIPRAGGRVRPRCRHRARRRPAGPDRRVRVYGLRCWRPWLFLGLSFIESFRVGGRGNAGESIDIAAPGTTIRQARNAHPATAFRSG